MDEIILVDKPAGMSSFLVVSKVRGVISRAIRGEGVSEEGMKGMLGRREGEEKNREVVGLAGEIGEEAREEYIGRGETVPRRIKVGHAGTLDPFATGLLIILVGKATKRAGEFLKLDKEYIAEIRLGATSNTGDPEGDVVEKFVEKGGKIFSAAGEVREIPGREEVERVVKGFLGESEQRVPMYSAVKINGERAYRLARKGMRVEMPVRKIHIYNIEVLEYEYPRLMVRAEVSSGTYIRALGEDIGEKLGVGAYLSGLRRTKIGKFRLEEKGEGACGGNRDVV